MQIAKYIVLASFSAARWKTNGKFAWKTHNDRGVELIQSLINPLAGKWVIWLGVYIDFKKYRQI